MEAELDMTPKEHAITTRYSRREEYANVATHGVGVLLSITALVVMVRYGRGTEDPYHAVSVSIFGASLILLYLMSTIYHATQHPKVKHVFRTLDHACIYLLIAGSYTPFALVSLRGTWGWTLLVIAWGLAFVGVVYKIFYTKRSGLLSTALYVGMGWLVVIAIRPVLDAVPTWGIVWLVAGGLLYTGGVVFYLWQRIPYHHAIWHVFVMLGSFCHFLAVFLYLIPKHA